MGRRWGGLCWLLAALWLAPQRARADGLADEAEVNFRIGAERYQAGDYRGALVHFLASNRLAPNDKVRFNIARAFQRLGQFPEAHRWCQAALAGETDPQLRSQLLETLATIEREVAILDVKSEPAGATIFIDRRDLGSVAVSPARIAVSPGEHSVLVELEGYEPQSSSGLAVARGAAATVPFRLRRIVGSVEVSAEAPTQVRVEAAQGPLECVTPCTLELPPGVHTLQFERAGFRTPSIQVQVRAAQRTTARVEAFVRTGSLLVTSAEQGALVEMDGVTVGFTPVVLRNVPVGERLVRVSAPGFQPREQRVQVEEQAQVQLRDLVLEPTREVTAAARLTQSIDEAPASVSLISAQELAAFRYPTIYEALRGQRGVALVDDGAYAGVSLRGLGQPGDYGNRLLVLSDGATLNDNIVWQSYVGYDGRVDLGDIESIELVRGPGSVLYGTGAVTGVVNLNPRALPKEPEAEFALGVQDTRTARARASGALPLARDGGLRLSASGAHAEGEHLTLPGRPRMSVDDFRRFDAATGNGRFEYRAFTAQAFLTTRKQAVPQGAYGALVGQKPNELQDTRGLFELRFEPELSERLRLFTRAYANLYWFHARQAYEGEVAERSVSEERYTGRWFGAEARAIAELAPSLQVSLGGEVTASTRAALEGETREAGVREVYLDEDEPYQLYAAYGLVEWRSARWLTISAGGRVDSWSTFGATVNPRLALIARPSERDVIKLMGGRAFRAPSIYELRYNDGGTTQVASDFGGNELRPELVWSGELEYTRHFPEGWSLLGAGHFQYALDLIEQAPVDPSAAEPVVRYRNGGSSVYTAGGDVELRRDFRAGFMLLASYTYLLARYTQPDEAGGDARVPNVPRHGASFRAVAPLGAGFRIALRSTVEAPRRISAYTRASSETAVITDLVVSGESPRYGLEYALGLYNLFDWRLALPTDPTFVTRTMPQPARSLLASLALRL